MRRILFALCLAAAPPASAQAVPPRGAAITTPLNATEARRTADELAKMLEARFVYPETGARYAAMLRTKAGAGGYDRFTDREALARAMTDDLQAVTPDGHLKVFAGDPDAPSAGTAPAGAPAPPPVRPPAMERAGWIAPGIAFVRFNLFPDDPAITAAAAKFMADHAEARTIIFDIRTHRGGGLAQMDAIFPWLFARPTRLLSMATRKSVDAEVGSVFGDAKSLRIVEASPDFVTREHWALPGSDTRLRDAKIYVLTAPRTGSAAEHFALAMKQTGRGTLIGSHTAGANHFGGIEKVGAFAAFIPVGRSYDPSNGKDWEGTGVLPDIDVAPERALVEALTRSGVAAADAERLSSDYMPTTPMVRKPR